MSGAIDHVALFGAGVASFLAPCVIPLMPAYVGMMVGEVGGGGSTGSVARAGSLFVAGFTAVFVGLGALAGQLGASVTSSEIWIQRVGGALVVVFGVLLLAAGRGRLVAERRPLAALAPAGRCTRPLVMGAAFGAAWTPCVGPLLGAALVLAAGSADPWRGATLLAAYALGVGAPFLAAALAVASWPALLGPLRRLSTRVEPIAGLVLVALGVLLVTGVYDRVLGPLARLLPGAP